ncbi:PepSY-associated TM helix domain-containing protein [Paraburkholderia sp. MMS20-SJTR3]|uniref:PepSY-associated TM helix domain-containing protein n=1 Tax=Paraburkholderia sejongensis TaxID=2886946 RepID=A0ABS8JMZ4_9BURK|nr:PepSY-associated TM helix domain-containing protein [Paraburkholderia sp. MMS20-SJTR3]MCC8391078.1 PepSY-associated TM helix domain-containing protein [Paraburkholderia sp. MMS20-SJTR3]
MGTTKVVEAGTFDAGQRSRAFWLRQLRQWHWISSALCLVGMLLFALTGFTLNHAAQIEAHPHVERRSASAPAALRDTLSHISPRDKSPKGSVPPELSAWLSSTLHINTAGRTAEWSGNDVYIALPRPGGDAWVSVDFTTGETQYELTTRGWIAYLNDLHKGRNAGAAWSVFIDIFAAACIVFSVTGLLLLKMHARGRVSTWPLVGFGLVAPLVLAILFIH